MKNKPLDRLKHHVTGAIERGEKEAIIGMNQCTLAKQYLIEAQTKLDAVIFRMNTAHAQNLDQSRDLLNEFYRLLSLVRRLEHELKTKESV